jgi:hypothetical protein
MALVIIIKSAMLKVCGMNIGPLFRLPRMILHRRTIAK